MEKIRLTETFMKKLTPGTAERFADTEIPGLQVRVSKSSISFYLRKRHGKKIHELILGKYPDMTLEEARHAALDKLGAIANYQDINAGSGRRDPLLREAIQLFVDHQSNKSSARSVLSHFAHLEERKIADIDPKEIRRVFDSMKDSPSAANHAVRYLGTAIRKLAKSLHTQLPDLVSDIPRYPSVPRTRVMREDEAPKVIAKLKEMTQKPMYSEQAEAILLMIYTGQRKSRVLGITAEQVDQEYRVWHVPGNDIKKPVDLALNDYAWEIVSRRIAKRRTGNLFLYRGKPIKECRKTFYTACEQLGIVGLHIHDLRRSLGTWMLSSGATIAEVSKTLGHSSIRTTEQVYAHLLQSTGRAATTTAIDAMQRGSTSATK